MDKKTANLFVGILIIGFIYFLVSYPGLFSTVGINTVERSAPNTVLPGESFTVTYAASSPETKWGVSIEDSISGGCTYGVDNTYRGVILSEDSLNPVSITIKAPSSGSCILSGDYQFGTDNIVNMRTFPIEVSDGTLCTSGQTRCDGKNSLICVQNEWVSEGQVDGKCGFVKPIEDEVCCGTLYLGEVEYDYVLESECAYPVVDTLCGRILVEPVKSFPWTILLIFLAIGLVIKFALDRYK